MTVEPSRRVRVTHPRTDAARRAPARPSSHEIDELTSVGRVYVDALIRSQRRLALLVCAAVAVLLGGTALLGALVPAYGRARLFGLAVPWLVLGVAVYPVLVALAGYAMRHAERNERAFLDLLRRR